MQKLILDLVEQHHIKLGFDKWHSHLSTVNSEYNNSYFVDDIHFNSFILRKRGSNNRGGMINYRHPTNGPSETYVFNMLTYKYISKLPKNYW